MFVVFVKVVETSMNDNQFGDGMKGPPMNEFVVILYALYGRDFRCKTRPDIERVI